MIFRFFLSKKGPFFTVKNSHFNWGWSPNGRFAGHIFGRAKKSTPKLARYDFSLFFVRKKVVCHGNKVAILRGDDAKKGAIFDIFFTARNKARRKMIDVIFRIFFKPKWHRALQFKKKKTFALLRGRNGRKRLLIFKTLPTFLVIWRAN